MHQSSQYLVRRLDLERGEALVEPANKINYYTESKELTEISILEQLKMATVGATQVCQGKVRVAAKVSHFELVVNCALGLVWPRFCPAFCTLFKTGLGSLRHESVATSGAQVVGYVKKQIFTDQVIGAS